MPVSFILIIVLFVVITIVHQEKQYDIYGQQAEVEYPCILEFCLHCWGVALSVVLAK